MRITRRVLFAENTQMKAQLAAHAHETRNGLKKKIAATGEENQTLKRENERLNRAVEELTSRLTSAEPVAA